MKSRRTAREEAAPPTTAPSRPGGASLTIERIAPSLLPLARPIADLMVDPKNARRHDEKNLAAVVESLRRFGQRVPVVARGVEIKAGHARVEAARRLGWNFIAVADADDLTEEEARAYAVADNRTAELAEWDLEPLAATLRDLPRDLQLATGFAEHELEPLLAAEWSPAAVDEGAEFSRGEGDDAGLVERKIAATREQWSAVDEALRRARGGDASMADGEALARVAEAFRP